jgi:hypothetical protein
VQCDRAGALKSQRPAAAQRELESAGAKATSGAHGRMRTLVRHCHSRGGQAACRRPKGKDEDESPSRPQEEDEGEEVMMGKCGASQWSRPFYRSQDPRIPG